MGLQPACAHFLRTLYVFLAGTGRTVRRSETMHTVTSIRTAGLATEHVGALMADGGAGRNRPGGSAKDETFANRRAASAAGGAARVMTAVVASPLDG